MVTRYDPQAAEEKWRAAWEAADLFRAKSPQEAGDAPKAYVLEMFPYPSGRLHMGHVRNYAMGDVVARYKRAKGIQCPPPDGMGCVWHAGRKRGHAEQGSPRRMDLPEH